MELRPHQIKAVEEAEPILKRWGIVYFALSCRVGKTLTALELANRASGGGKVLWVTPKAAIPSILADSKAMGGWGDRLVVTNREALHKAEKCRYAVIVADEAHRDGAFPKPSKAVREMKSLANGCKAILLSGTPSVETSAQLFHQFWWSGLGPWAGISNFYEWHSRFGVHKTKKVAGGRVVKDFTEMQPIILEQIKPYMVTMTQEQAGFKHQPQIIPHRIDPPWELLSWEKQFKQTGSWDFFGRQVVAEGPAAVLQKMHMAEGGTLIDEDGYGFTHDMSPDYKIQYMKKRMEIGKEYAITTAYIEEREFVALHLGAAGHKIIDNLEDFKPGCGGVFVGSGISNAEGVDFAWMTGAMVIYSLNWSGSKFLQLIERQNNFLRERPIKVHVLLCSGGVDEMVFKAVSNKQNFNNSFFRRCS